MRMDAPWGGLLVAKAYDLNLECIGWGVRFRQVPGSWLACRGWLDSPKDHGLPLLWPVFAFSPFAICVARLLSHPLLPFRRWAA